jgi:hypothetical protein
VKRKPMLAAIVILAPSVIATAHSRGWQARPEAVAQATQQPGFNERRVAGCGLHTADPLA